MSAIQTHPVSEHHILQKTTQKDRVLRLPVKDFEVHPWLGNPHFMTVVAEYWPRNLSTLPQATERLFEVEAGTRLLAKCHWQVTPRRHPTLVLVHGLEGSSESRYMLGIAEKAFAAGLNVLRVNQRNCGGTEHLTPTLYESGLSRDYRAVLEELIEKDRLPEISFAGYSMGGNLVVKMAGEFDAHPPRELRGICAVCPSLDLAASSRASDEPKNILYKWHFLWSFRRRIRRKAELFPEWYQAVGLWRLRTMREWHEAITAPACGYRDAADYYYRASALRVVDQIRVPTLILAAQDDPIIPIASFRNPRIAGNPFITLVTPEHGGHCGFVSQNSGDERFWAEPRVVEFCTQHSTISNAQQSKRESRLSRIRGASDFPNFSVETKRGGLNVLQLIGFVINARKNFRWPWLLVPAVAVLASLQHYFVLQLLSAFLLFTALFMIFAVLVAVFLSLLVVIDHIFQWSVVMLAPIGRVLRSSVRDIVMFTMRASAISHLVRDAGRVIRNQL